jgi:nucleotide-binding universal stress UspA family protein
MTIPRRIVVATDFSECSRRAVDLAVDLAQALRANLEIVHVWELAPFMSMGIDSGAELVTAIENSARSRLEDEVARVRKTLPSTTGVLRGGVAWDEIVRVAAEQLGDLIIVGTHGRTGLRRALMGSVASRVVRASKVPVMTVKPSPERMSPDLGM